MSTYKQIAGTTVKAYTTNPSDPQEGEMWYNQTTLKLRGVTAVGAWSSASPNITARPGTLGSSGTQTLALVFGGHPPTNATEAWNGSGFNTAPNLNTARGLGAGFGATQDAALAACGYPSSTNTNATEEYDGSSWTNQTGAPYSARGVSGNGTQTAGLIAGGYTTTDVSTAAEYDGSSWTSATSMPTVKNYGVTLGIQTAALTMGGYDPTSGSGTSQKVFAYDGTNWTASPDLAAPGFNQAGVSGTTSAGLAFGGTGSPGSAIATTQVWNGTSWAISPATLGTASNGTTGVGTGTNAIKMTGTPSATELYNFSAQVVTAGAWASGGALPSARQSPAGFGSKTAAVACGGEEPGTPGVNTTDNYDGTSWTNSGNYPFAASEIGALGTQTAGIGMGGYQVPSPRTRSNASNEYDGSTWTAGGTYPISASNVRGCGTQTAALGVAGDTYPPAPTRNSDVTAEYNGTTWTAGGSLGTAGYAGHAGGTQTEAVFSGGTGRNSLTEEYNGSSWSTGGAPLYPIGFGGHTNGSPASNFANFGTNASANQNQLYDGTSYATQPSLVTNRQSSGGAGDSGTAGIIFGGRVPPPFKTDTEEFTAESTSVNSVDITTAE